MKKGLYLVGGGGHCHACIDVIESAGDLQILGVIDLPEKLGETILGYQIVATDQDLANLAKTDCAFLLTLGQISSALPRIKLFNALKKVDADFLTAISPLAHVSRHATLGEGTCVMHNAIVNAGAKVGSNCILNTNSLIEHDAQVGDHCHISTGAVVNGGCKVGEGAFIGSNSVLTQGVSVASHVVVGAGSMVHKDICEAGTYVGNPCRKILPPGIRASD